MALSAPAPKAQVVLPYNGYYPYAAAPVLAYAPLGKKNINNYTKIDRFYLESGLVYPVAPAYEHDATGDTSDDSYPAAEPYVHDPTGDA